MASASGTLVPPITRLVAADEDTVRDAIHLFNQKGLAALTLSGREAGLTGQTACGKLNTRSGS